MARRERVWDEAGGARDCLAALFLPPGLGRPNWLVLRRKKSSPGWGKGRDPHPLCMPLQSSLQPRSLKPCKRRRAALQLPPAPYLPGDKRRRFVAAAFAWADQDWRLPIETPEQGGVWGDGRGCQLLPWGKEAVVPIQATGLPLGCAGGFSSSSSAAATCTTAADAAAPSISPPPPKWSKVVLQSLRQLTTRREQQRSWLSGEGSCGRICFALRLPPHRRKRGRLLRAGLWARLHPAALPYGQGQWRGEGGLGAERKRNQPSPAAALVQLTPCCQPSQPSGRLCVLLLLPAGGSGHTASLCPLPLCAEAGSDGPAAAEAKAGLRWGQPLTTGWPLVPGCPQP